MGGKGRGGFRLVWGRRLEFLTWGGGSGPSRFVGFGGASSSASRFLGFRAFAPNASGLSLTGVRLIIPVHAWGFPCARVLMAPHPVSGGGTRRSSHQRVSLHGKGHRVGLRIVLFEACSAFTALRPARARGRFCVVV